MKIKVRKSQLNGEITVPGSKSHTIRALAIATAAKGESIIRDPLISGDTLACVNAAQSLGAKVVKEKNLWKINGTEGRFTQPEKSIDMQNSGTSLRVFTGLAAMAGFSVGFDGDDSLRSRPMGQLLDALQELGVSVESNGGKCPLSVKGPAKGGKTTVDGASSQFLTSLLIALPLAVDDSEIKVFNLNEKPYVEITLDWLSRQGIQLEYNDDMSRFHIKGGQKYSAFDSIIPADFSTAAFPLVGAALTGGEVLIRNLDFNDRQGDKAVFDYLERMGTKIERQEKVTKVTASSQLSGREFDLNATPDALPVMAVAGACANGVTSLLDCPQARIKETDRIKCMTCELRKLGVDIEELEDGMIINSGNKLTGTEVEGYDDHRIVMALTIAGMVAEGETLINGAEAAAVTYPSFIEDFSRLGADIEVL